MYESRAYDKTNDAGFGPDPVVVLVVTGTNDVSRLVNLFAGGQPVIEQIAIGQQMLRQVKRHSGGRAALALLRGHGGPDFTVDPLTLLKELEYERIQLLLELRDAAPTAEEATHDA